jgi:hypothetical protein
MVAEESSWISFIPLIMLSLSLGITAFFLAKDKGRNVALWTILGLIPLLNFLCIWYFVGSSSRKLDEKLDQIISQMNASQ